jgi:hypothetical protein
MIWDGTQNISTEVCGPASPALLLIKEDGSRCLTQAFLGYSQLQSSEVEVAARCWYMPLKPNWKKLLLL